MIRSADIKQVEEIKAILEKQGNPNGTSLSWDTISKIELLDRMVKNLKIAQFSYRYASDEDAKHNFYTAECSSCGWWGSSKLLDGGGQIADTGDYEDCYCPVCGNTELDDKEESSVENARDFLDEWMVAQGYKTSESVGYSIVADFAEAYHQRICKNG